MPTYAEFRKKYCACCDSKDFCNVRLRVSDDMLRSSDCIHWELKMQSEPFRGKICDAVYDGSVSKVFFIEFKNAIWFYKNSMESILNSLLKKFENSYNTYNADGNSISDYENICSFDENTNSHIDEQMTSNGFVKRNIYLNFYTKLQENKISLMECESAFYYMTNL
ncbi:MAG: hypothetical protein IKA25_03570 [Alphaproteobacteria bacterium]|nr:hypothetical protein [Alphaproteobacteria bacterium]